MQFHFLTLEACHNVTGAVVVIDVIRAFTTAAYAFAAGAAKILPVASVDDAWALRQRLPDARLMGEAGGLPLAGFDFGNSPAALIGRDLTGQTLIQRTSAGTQGIVRSVGAKPLLAGSFVCAGATARYLRRLAPPAVTFVNTTAHGEDAACAAYIKAVLHDEIPPTQTLLHQAHEAGLQHLHEAKKGGAFSATELASLEADFDYCLALDRFNFAMLVEEQAGLLQMTAVT